MTTLLLNAFLVLITILFGAMALYPLFITGTDTELHAESIGEDRVISVVPLGLEPQRPTQIGPTVADDVPHKYPDHQTAA